MIQQNSHYKISFLWWWVLEQHGTMNEPIQINMKQLEDVCISLWMSTSPEERQAAERFLLAFREKGFEDQLPWEVLSEWKWKWRD